MIEKPNQPVLALLTGHWLGLIGSGVVTAAVISWRFVLPLSVRGRVSNPYIGIIAFIALPIVFFVGLALIPIRRMAFEPPNPKRHIACLSRVEFGRDERFRHDENR